MRSRVSLVLVSALFACTLVFVPSVLGSHADVGPNVKVTDDNNNVDGGLNNVTPSKDAQNRQANEPSVAINDRQPSPVTGQVGDIVAEASNDYRLVPHTTDVWLGFYLSFNGGTTWFGMPPFPNGFNTMVPGFPTDTSAAGQASPLLGLDGAGDPLVRFDRQGNLLVGGIAFNRQRDPGRASARHGRLRREVQLHAGHAGNGEHDHERQAHRRTSRTPGRRSSTAARSASRSRAGSRATSPTSRGWRST